GRAARRKGLCGPHAAAVLRSTDERDAIIAGLSPLPSLGPCRVAACDRVAYGPNLRLCRAHYNRWRSFSKAKSAADLDAWCWRESQVSDSRRVCFGGLHPG